ncbi:MAG: phosphodiester glycosidase family protein [Deltaproteobacteria bacterium]|nr:phosphodiester glycosidase family protein [Deltaproteobacteria bacterium]
MGLIIGLLAQTLPLYGADSGGKSGKTAGRPDLPALIWALGGYIQSLNLDNDLSRELIIAQEGQPGYTLKATMAKMSGRPERLSLWELGREILSDQKPFGTVNLKGPKTVREEERLLARVLELLDLNPKTEKPQFQNLEEGLDTARVKTNYGLRLGPAELIIFRADPRKFTLRPYYEGEERFRGAGGADIRVWSQRLPYSRLIFNGGQYYPDRRPMGYAKRDGIILEKRIHKTYQGFLAQTAGGLDILDSPDLKDPLFGESASILQSYMLLDRNRNIRVRNSDHLASRTLVGLDKAGFVWIIFAPGAVSVFDLAVLTRDLGLQKAVGLDGGLETQWSWNRNCGSDNSGEAKEPGFWPESGTYAHSALGNFKLSDFGSTLPVVLSLERLE